MSLTFQYGNIVRSLPRVRYPVVSLSNLKLLFSYIMSVDIWVSVACLFITLTLLELAIVGYLDRSDRSEKKKRNRRMFDDPYDDRRVSVDNMPKQDGYLRLRKLQSGRRCAAMGRSSKTATLKVRTRTSTEG